VPSHCDFSFEKARPLLHRPLPAPLTATARLTGGPDARSGRLELRLQDGSYYPICAKLFGFKDADVICHELKLGEYGVPLPGTPFSPHSLRLNFELGCSGMESSWMDCDWRGREKNFTCTEGAVGIRCQDTKPPGVGQPCAKLNMSSRGSCANACFHNASFHGQGQWARPLT